MADIKKDTPLHVRLSPTMSSGLYKLAQKVGMNKSQYVRHLIVKELEKDKNREINLN